MTNKHDQSAPSVSDPGANPVSMIQTTPMAFASSAAQADNTVQAPASVAEQARALKNNPDLIFEHVYSQVEFYPVHGLQKGSFGTLVDGIGTAHDQCQLLVDLLTAAGYTASFVNGTIELTIAQAAAWLGTDTSGTDSENMSNITGLLDAGRIPYTTPDSTHVRLTDYVWVMVTINGTDYYMDPSYKTYTETAGMSSSALASAMGYSQSTFLADAESGSQIDAANSPPQWIQNINLKGTPTSPGVYDNLTTYSTNLIDWIKTNNKLYYATIGGTITAGDEIAITAYNIGFTGGKKSVSYTTSGGDTPTSIATALKNAINADTDFTANGITATSSAGKITITPTSGDTTSFGGETNINATETIDVSNPQTTLEDIIGGRDISGTPTRYLAASGLPYQVTATQWSAIPSALATIGGTITNADVVTLTAANAGLPSGTTSVNYTVQGSDTLTSIATALAAQVNGNSNLAAQNITATASGAVVTLYSASANATTWRHSVSGSATETVTFKIFKTFVRIQQTALGIDYKATADQLYGKRLTLFFPTLTLPSAPEFLLDGVSVVSCNPVSGYDGSLPWVITVTLPDGTIEAIGNLATRKPFSVPTPGTKGTYCNLGFWFGATRKGMVDYHRRRVQANIAAGGTDLSDAVLGEILAVQQATYAAQMNAVADVVGRMTNTRILVSHWVGQFARDTLEDAMRTDLQPASVESIRLAVLDEAVNPDPQASKKQAMTTMMAYGQACEAFVTQQLSGKTASVAGLNGIKLANNGTVAVIGGTVSSGHTLTIKITDSGLTGGEKSISHNTTGVSTLTSIATALKDAINADTELQSLGIKASAKSPGSPLTWPYVEIFSNSPNKTNYSVSTSGGGAETISLLSSVGIMGGTVTVGDAVAVDVYNSGLPGGKISKSYTVVTNDTLELIASGLATAINGDSNLSASGITAQASGVFIKIASTSANETSFSSSVSGTGSTETLTFRGIKILHGRSGNFTTILGKLKNYLSGSINVSATAGPFITAGWSVLLPEWGTILVDGLDADSWVILPGAADQIGAAGWVEYFAGTLSKGGIGRWKYKMLPMCECRECEDEEEGPQSPPAGGGGGGLPPGGCDKGSPSGAVGKRTGAFKYNQSDMTVGSSSHPYSLSFATDYDSRERHVEGPLGFGWRHNWLMAASENTNVFRGFGSESPIEAAASLVSIHVVKDLVTDTSQPATKSAGAWLTAGWWMDQVTNNNVTVELPCQTVGFNRLPDGSYNASIGYAMELTRNGSQFTVTTPEKTVYSYNSDGIVEGTRNLSSITYPQGVTVSLGYNGDKLLSSVSNGLGRTLSLTYTSGKLSAVSDGTGRSVQYNVDGNKNLTSITNTLGDATTFQYDQPGRMTKYFMPQQPSLLVGDPIPMVTNTYDTLDRVKSQVDANNRWTATIGSTKFTVGGTITANDVLTIMVRDAGLSGGQKSISYTVQPGDTTTTIATALKNAIDADTAITTMGISATSSGAVITLSSTSPNGTSYSASTSVLATETLTATPTIGGILTITVHDAGLSGGQKSVAYTVQSGDSPTSIATNLAAAINADTALAALGVKAETANTPAITLSSFDGNSTTYTQSATGGSTETIALSNQKIFYLAGWRSEFTNPVGFSQVQNYDKDDNVLQDIDELGNITSHVWDALGREVRMTMPEGDSVIYAYDKVNNAVLETRVPKPGSGLANIVMHNTFDPTWNKVKTATDGNGNTTTFTYHATTGNLLKVERPAVGGQVPTVRMAYNTRGQMTSRIDETGIQTKFEYDGSTEKLNSVKVSSNYTATVSGTVTATDQLTITAIDSGLPGGQRSVNYTVQSGNSLVDIALGLADAVNNDSVLAAQGITAQANTAQANSPAVNLSSTSVNTTTFSVSKSGGATETFIISAGLSLTTSIGYDSAGNPTSVTDPRSNQTTFQFDAMRKLTQRTECAPFSFITNFAYDRNSNMLSVQRQAPGGTWQTHSMTYSLTNKKLMVVDPANNTTIWTFDGFDRVLSMTDAENRKQLSAYDARNRNSQATDPTGTIYDTRTFTRNGKMSSIYDGRGNTKRYTLDGFDRADKTIYADSSFEQNQSYDANGNVLTYLTRSGNSIINTFDVLNRRITKGPQGQPQVTYSFDLAGHLIEASKPVVSGDPSSGAMQFLFDTAGRFYQQQYPDGKTITHQLDNNGNRTVTTWPDGYFVTRVFDQLNRLTDIKLNGSGTSAAQFSYNELSQRTQLAYSNGAVITYSPQLNEDLTRITHNFVGSSAVFRYGFNGVHQAISRSVSDPAYLYSPPVGTDTYGTADSVNKYPNVNGTTYGYDGNMNLTTDGTWTYGYDTENHLLSATKTGVNASFVYDPMHKQSQKTVGSTKIRYIYSGWQRIADYDGTTGLLQNRYIYGLGLDEPIIIVSSVGALTFLHRDRLGSIVATSDNTGVAGSNKNAYGPFGEINALFGSTFGFTGQRFDSELGLYYYKHRYYSPKLGRFLQPDPIGNSKNLYSYVENDPVNYSDVFGLFNTGLGFARAFVRPGSFTPAGLAVTVAALSYEYLVYLKMHEHWKKFYDEEEERITEWLEGCRNEARNDRVKQETKLREDYEKAKREIEKCPKKATPEEREIARKKLEELNQWFDEQLDWIKSNESFKIRGCEAGAKEMLDQTLKMEPKPPLTGE